MNTTRPDRLRLWLILSVWLTMGCADAPEMLAEVPFELPEECDESNGVNQCTELAYDEIARRGGGRSYDTRSSTNLPQDLLRVVDQASPTDGSGLDLMLLVDGTGSMTDELAALQATADELIERLLEKAGPSSRLGLTIYRDRCTDLQWLQFFDLTDNVALARQSILNARATGGGDIPESIYEAIEEATRRSTWKHDRRAIVIIGDSPPHNRGECHNLTLKEAVDDAHAADVTLYAIVVPQYGP